MKGLSAFAVTGILSDCLTRCLYHHREGAMRFDVAVDDSTLDLESNNKDSTPVRSRSLLAAMPGSQTCLNADRRVAVAGTETLTMSDECDIGCDVGCDDCSK